MNAAELLAAKRLRETTLHLTVGGEPVPILMRALPRIEYRALIDAHPGEKKEDDWHPDTFPPALIAASCVEPEFTLEQANEIWEQWETEEASRLFLTAFYLNENSGRINFTLLGSARTRGSEQSSTTASPEESPTPSS